jgi:hypothetical protein
MVNAIVLLMPVEFFTGTNRFDLVALEARTKFAVRVVPEVPTGVTDVNVTPPPVIWIGIEESEVKFLPVSVTLTA